MCLRCVCWNVGKQLDFVCTYGVVVIPEYVGWRFWRVKDDARQINGRATFDVHVGGANDVGGWF